MNTFDAGGSKWEWETVLKGGDWVGEARWIEDGEKRSTVLSTSPCRTQKEAEIFIIWMIGNVEGRWSEMEKREAAR